MGASSRLRRLMAGDGLVVAPGVFDGLSARLAEVAGFEVLYVTGGGIARGAGLPELGLLAMTEVAERCGVSRRYGARPQVIRTSTFAQGADV